MAGKDDTILSLDDLEKSWSDSKTLLKSILDEGTETETLEKAKKEKSEKSESADFDEMVEDDDEEHEDDETEEEEEVEEEAKAKMKKSLTDEMDSDEESVAAMDVEPFLRKMVKSMSKKFSDMESDTKKLKEVLAKSLMMIGDQNLTIAGLVHEIAEAPVGSRSVIRKSQERFESKEGTAGNELLKSMTVDQILDKAVRLSKSGKMTSLDVAKIQNRLNKSIPLNEEYVVLLTKEDK